MMVLGFEYYNMEATTGVPDVRVEPGPPTVPQSSTTQDASTNKIDDQLRNLKGKSSEISIMLGRVEWNAMSQEWQEFIHSPANQPPSSGNVVSQEFGAMVKWVIEELRNIMKCVFREELTAWKFEQRQLQCSSVILMRSLDAIESWCEDLLQIILKTAQQLQEAEKFFEGGTFNSELQSVRLAVQNLLLELVSSALVVEDQPPRVVKKMTKFSKAIALRCLCRSLFNYNQVDLSKSEMQPIVEMRFVSEAHARQMNETSLNQRPTKTSAAFQKSKDFLASKLEFKGKSTKVWSVFRNVQLTKIDDRKGPISTPKTDTVTDAKFCLHFHSEFKLGGLELKMSTISCPIVVVTHGVQESQAWATINWDNAFAEPHRVPFQVPSKVSWTQLSTLLNSLFTNATGGRGLTEKNLKYLQENVCGQEKSGVGPFSPHCVSWTRFCKSILADRTFSFWDWFYAAEKLIEKHGRNFWHDGIIMGFIGKTEAEDLLSMCQPGTFILRFSDSVLGGISIAFTKPGGIVQSFAPLTGKHFQIKSLADTIKDLEELRFVYPFTPKDTVFAKHYSPDIPATTKASRGPGYVNTRTKLIACTVAPSSPTKEQTAAESNYMLRPLTTEDKENASLYSIPSQMQFVPTTTSTPTNTFTFPQHTETTEGMDVMMTSFESDDQIQSSSSCTTHN